jgi:phosphoglycolate phosphatase-like HAD superfamily hydrolase
MQEADSTLPSFDIIVARDSHSELPPKPDPASLIHIAKEWQMQLPSKEILMVGDSPTNDILFGKAAGVSTALVDTGRRYIVNKDGKTEATGGADICVDHMGSLARHLWLNFYIDSPLGTDGLCTNNILNRNQQQDLG